MGCRQHSVHLSQFPQHLIIDIKCKTTILREYTRTVQFMATPNSGLTDPIELLILKMTPSHSSSASRWRKNIIHPSLPKQDAKVKLATRLLYFSWGVPAWLRLSLDRHLMLWLKRRWMALFLMCSLVKKKAYFAQKGVLKDGMLCVNSDLPIFEGLGKCSFQSEQDEQMSPCLLQKNFLVVA